jgi:hypothetical protein
MLDQLAMVSLFSWAAVSDPKVKASMKLPDELKQFSAAKRKPRIKRLSFVLPFRSSVVPLRLLCSFSQRLEVSQVC